MSEADVALRKIVALVAASESGVLNRMRTARFSLPYRCNPFAHVADGFAERNAGQYLAARGDRHAIDSLGAFFYSIAPVLIGGKGKQGAAALDKTHLFGRAKVIDEMTAQIRRCEKIITLGAAIELARERKHGIEFVNIPSKERDINGHGNSGASSRLNARDRSLQ